MPDLILTVAHGPMCDDPMYRVFLNSFERNAASGGTELVVFTGAMSDAARRATERVGRVVEVDENFSHSGCQRRHWYYARFLFENGHRYGRVLTVDARDTVVQHDPFGWELGEGNTLMLSAEPARTPEQGWNHRMHRKLAATLKDWFVPGERPRRGLSRSLRLLLERGPGRRPRPCEGTTTFWPNEPWTIINGGFVLAEALPAAYFELCRVAIDAPVGATDDQATLTALGNWTRGWSGIRIAGHEEPWVYHGFWWDKRPFRVEDGATVVLPDSGRPYRLFHQWQHTPAKDAILQAYA
jgi:hypothetical protein